MCRPHIIVTVKQDDAQRVMVCSSLCNMLSVAEHHVIYSVQYKIKHTVEKGVISKILCHLFILDPNMLWSILRYGLQKLP